MVALGMGIAVYDSVVVICRSDGAIVIVIIVLLVAR